MPPWNVMSYDALFRSFSLRGAVYIFTDLDRLNFWDLELAARHYRNIRKAGAPALNDPARFKPRFDLLNDLFESGVNSFRVWRPRSSHLVDRFPVFLRTERAHRGPLGDLLHTPEELATALAAADAAGFPYTDLMIVEYRAAPLRDGLYRKLAIQRIGERMVQWPSVHEGGWKAKSGTLGVAGQELYDEEFHSIRDGAYAQSARPAFDVAEIEYGRADFTTVDGRLEIYEINTNPTIGRVRKHPFPVRVESSRLAHEQFAAALAALIPAELPRKISIGDPVLIAQRNRDLYGFIRTRRPK